MNNEVFVDEMDSDLMPGEIVLGPFPFRRPSDIMKTLKKADLRLGRGDGFSVELKTLSGGGVVTASGPGVCAYLLSADGYEAPPEDVLLLASQMGPGPGRIQGFHHLTEREILYCRAHFLLNDDEVILDVDRFVIQDGIGSTMQREDRYRGSVPGFVKKGDGIE